MHFLTILHAVPSKKKKNSLFRIFVQEYGQYMEKTAHCKLDYIYLQSFKLSKYSTRIQDMQFNIIHCNLNLSSADIISFLYCKD